MRRGHAWMWSFEWVPGWEWSGSEAAALLWYADRRRFGPHACKKCGYDRRGLAADAKCPECGTVPTSG